jgi:DNA segregation ATPase FtsK/SpoIIIE, S-DNA-T family
MTVASSSSASKGGARRRFKLRIPNLLRLAPEKGDEVLGVVFATLGLLLLLSLVSHDTTDPSLMHREPALSSEVGASGVAEAEASADVANWIGPVGAQLSAGSFLLVGLSALLVPLFLFVAARRKLSSADSATPFGRGLGMGLLLVALPPLLQLTLGQVPWRGGVLEAGGALGLALSGVLSDKLHLTGALLVLLAVVVTGASLVVQATLGEMLAAAHSRGRGWIENLSLARARRAERKEKSKAKERVVARQLARSGAAPETVDEAEAPRPPLKVTERRGEGSFSVRRVSAAELPEAQAEALSGGAMGGTETASAAEPTADRKPARKKTPPAQMSFDQRASAGPLPPINLLQLDNTEEQVDEAELVRLGETIQTRCAEFGVEGTIVGINPGPVITVYEFQPAPGVKVSQIVNLQDDMALALKAESVRIDRLAGRSTLGIEVPNEKRQIIRLGNLISDSKFQKSQSLLTFALGKTIQGETYYADLATMPHLLVAGATGAGKSVGLQSMITSILYKARPEEVKFIFIDPKRIELGVYRDIPHLAAEVVVDPKKAANALQNMVREMERRYKLLAEVHVRSIAYYNRAIADPEVQKRLALSEDDGDSDVSLDDLKPLPYFVIVIDELADLMMVASSEVETSIARLAQMARAVGIHLIIATQRPSVDVLTGTIKANFPCRMAFATATRHDSRTILDQIGAEKLLGKGDMLFMPPGTSRILRLHGAYTSEQETAGLVRWLKKQGKPDYDPELLEPPESDRGGGDMDGGDDELYDEAARLVVSEGSGSASFLQRRLRVGFSRASRLIDMMEADGILGPPQGSKPREVLVKPDFYEEIDKHQ